MSLLDLTCDGCKTDAMMHRLAYDTPEGGRVGAALHHYRVRCLDRSGNSRSGKTFVFCPDCYADFIGHRPLTLHELNDQREREAMQQ